MEPVLGIDFGTTNSAVAWLDGNSPRILPSRTGDTVIPSVLAFQRDGKVVVGEEAVRREALGEPCIFRGVKRYLGTSHRFKVGRARYAPEELASFILRHLRNEAEASLRRPLSKAVLTVPAFFNDNQRQAAKHAGELAGLEILRLVNEPTAAALAYSQQRQRNARVLIFDLGGGTVDVSILEIAEGVHEVLATAGRNSLGGETFDTALVRDMQRRFFRQSGLDVSEDAYALARLRQEAETAKIALSESRGVGVEIPYLSSREGGPHHFNETYTRQELEGLILRGAQELRAPVQEALRLARMEPGQLDYALLVGGSTRMPLVQRLAAEWLRPAEIVAAHPQQSVALGAALVGGMLAGDVRDAVLVDITPMTLGIETENGAVSTLIPRGSAVPTQRRKLFSTVVNNQTTVEIHVLQGESRKAGENVSLGRFQLTGIRNAPAQQPRIEVAFDIDADGIVHVAGRDLDTGAEQKIIIRNANRLDAHEMDRLRHRGGEEMRVDETLEMHKTGVALLERSRGLLRDMIPEERQVLAESLQLLRHALEDGSGPSVEDCIDEVEFLMSEVEPV